MMKELEMLIIRISYSFHITDISDTNIFYRKEEVYGVHSIGENRSESV